MSCYVQKRDYGFINLTGQTGTLVLTNCLIVVPTAESYRDPYHFKHEDENEVEELEEQGKAEEVTETKGLQASKREIAATQREIYPEIDIDYSTDLADSEEKIGDIVDGFIVHMELMELQKRDDEEALLLLLN